MIFPSICTSEIFSFCFWWYGNYSFWRDRYRGAAKSFITCII